ncbi:MAC/perforin domain-containing protein [Chryseobacterium sp. PTM-20240506]|uniref:MAC/perforin domain-containing protein n=1 Tax=Chryseobacterium sp. PTM-20240506 TaxID=3400631 RepID=UPI003AAA4993
MMKQILFCISTSLILFMSSCSSDEVIETTPETSNENPISLEDSKEFGYYNALGYGYNVTGEYANSNSTGFKVLDIDKFKTEQSARLVDENTLTQEYSDEYGEDAAAFSKVISRKVSATDQMLLYGKTISSPFKSAVINNHSYFDPKFIYGSYNILIKQKRFRINATTDLLTNYVTQNFLKDLQIKTPEQIVHDYGTHVTVDIYTGAKLDIFFQAQTTNHDRSKAARAGIAIAVNGLKSITSNDINVQEASKNYSKKLYYKTRGGEPSKRFANILNIDQSIPKINISDWQSTSTKDNSVLVDFGPHGLVILYDLIKDPIKKSQMKSYIDQYLATNQVLLSK